MPPREVRRGTPQHSFVDLCRLSLCSINVTFNDIFNGVTILLIISSISIGISISIRIRISFRKPPKRFTYCLRVENKGPSQAKSSPDAINNCSREPFGLQPKTLGCRGAGVEGSGVYGFRGSESTV